MNRSNFGAVRLPLLAAAVLASFAASLSAQVVEKGRTYADLVATHPCNSGNSGRLARVTDCDAADDIGDGEGAFQCWASCDGSAPWVTQAIGGGGTGDVLLAGDADGQTIQGLTGADAARVDIGETDPDQVTLIGPGATPGRVYAHSGGVYAVSPDGGTSFDIYDQGFEFNTDGAAGLYGGTSTGVGSTEGVLNLAGSRINVHSQQSPPTNANDSCTAGDTIDTATFHYYCEATNSWVRAPMASW